MNSKNIMQNSILKNVNWGGLLSLLYGLACSLILLLLLSFIGSTLVYFSDLPERSLYLVAVIVNLIAMFGGGFVAALKGQNKGLWRGLAVGLIMLLIMLLTGNLPFAQLASKAGYCLPAAALGGVFGVK